MIGRQTLFHTVALVGILASVGSSYAAWSRATVYRPRRQNALALAISQRDSATVAKLLHAGANANAPVEPPTRDLGHLGYTPLSIAVLREDPVIVRMLLEHGADPNKRLAQIRPLMISAGKGDLASARLLLKSGADPNAASCYGRTALSTARANGDVLMVRLLLDYGADPTHEKQWRASLASAIRNYTPPPVVSQRVDTEFPAGKR